MLWIASVVANSVIFVAFALIAFTTARGLWRSGQLWSNRLGLATAAIFAWCAIGHGSHALHMVLPFVGIERDQGLAWRSAIDVHVDIIDFATAGVALWYWTLRPRFRELLETGALFTDLQRRFESQSKALETTGRIADAFQRALAPKDLPTTELFTFDAIYLPAENTARIGGDWYDAFALPDGRIGFMIGDVTGHGLDAAAATSRGREAIVATAYETTDPATVLGRVNRMFCYRRLPLMTAIYGVIDPRSMEIRYATAGHPSPLLVESNEAPRFLPHDGIPLGVELAAEYVTFSVHLREGTMLVLYTDGVIEFNRNLFDGEARLMHAVQQVAARPSAQPSREILRSVLGQSAPRDDIAVMTIKCIGEPAVIRSHRGQRWVYDIADPQAASRLRTRVTAAITERVAGQCDLGATELIIGELLSNVARHTPGKVTVELDWSVQPCTLTVRDNGGGFVVQGRLPDDPFCENGRGMYLVRVLALAVDVMHDGAGCAVRVALPLAISAFTR